MIKAKCIRSHSTIGIVTPSSEIASFLRRRERGIKSLERFGFKAVLLENALKKKGCDAGTAMERASDIINAFKNKEISAIMASTGGYTSNTVLEHLDFKIIAENPKIFIGSSDITALLLALYSKTGLITFHGPTLLPSFGDASGVHHETLTALKKIIMTPFGGLDLPTKLSSFSEDNLFWDEEDDRPRSYSPDEGAFCIRPGIAEGIILGGNFDTILGIVGTSYCPDFSGSILFLEEIFGTTSKTVRNLKTLEYLGVLKRITGLVFGRRYHYVDNSPPNDIRYYLREIGDKYNIPILDNLPFGHTEPKITLPIGIRARLDTEMLSIRLLESCTVGPIEH